MGDLVLGSVFATVGVGLLATAAFVHRVVRRQNSALAAGVAALLFAGPGVALVSFALGLALSGRL